jgi:hypothetical protein
MLRPADAGPGQWDVTDGGVEGDWNLGYTLSICGTAPASGYVEEVDRRLRYINQPPNRNLTTDVQLYRQGGALTTFDWYRRGVAACVNRLAPGGSSSSARIVAEGFAGERSMIVQSGQSMWVLVVQNNLITQVKFLPATVAYGKQLGVRAAARMCAVQGTCG